MDTRATDLTGGAGDKLCINTDKPLQALTLICSHYIQPLLRVTWNRLAYHKSQKHPFALVKTFIIATKP